MGVEKLVDKLLEADDTATMSDVNRYMETSDFDRGAADIISDARRLYLQLVKDGTIPTLLKERPTMDESALAQAVIMRAIERRDALGRKTAYKRIRQLNPWNF